MTVSLVDILNSLDTDKREEFLRLVEGWADEVVHLVLDSTDQLDGMSLPVGCDDLFAAYKARDRIQKIVGNQIPVLVQVSDQLLLSISDRAGRAWISLTGIEPLAGSGWWWEWLPRGPKIRSEASFCFDEQ